MKKFLMMTLVLAGVISCGPPRIEKSVEIKANETAFVIPLEGASKSKQGKFGSEDYLNELKVATKRVIIPRRERSVGRMWWSYEWIDSVVVIKVNRSPVTVKWVKDEESDTDAIRVETENSIVFFPGVNITSSIKEDNTAKYLYNFPSKGLSKVLNTNVRSYVQGLLSSKFGELTLDECRKQKNRIFAETFEETKEYFADYGITIDMLNLAGGLVYENPEIQRIIDASFMAEGKTAIAAHELAAQKDINAREVSIARAEKDKALEFAKAKDAQKLMLQMEIKKMEAEAKLIIAKKWNGHLPEKIMPQGSSFLFNEK